MKSLFYPVIFSILFLSNFAHAQSAEAGAVERVYGAQIGYLGAWGYAELPLGRQVVARLSAGMDAGVRWGSYYETTDFALVPVIAASPRWYYNLDKRMRKDKWTARNAANFFSLPVTYHPGWFTITDERGIGADKGISIIPTWGIRRNLGKHLNVEVGFGFGYSLRWLQFDNRRSRGAIWIPLRIGF
ncbi:hypothetical protein [Lewinella sp. IMCC34191]|uniref:hypothetical protein n=1 Tax=Lewinella sp. IMCC34191 TaxID=2259172 RepID=UPI000E284D9E|nr:hypothetical protein [Lewinella sp. IMCC34191]